MKLEQGVAAFLCMHRNMHETSCSNRGALPETWIFMISVNVKERRHELTVKFWRDRLHTSCTWGHGNSDFELFLYAKIFVYSAVANAVSVNTQDRHNACYKVTSLCPRKTVDSRMPWPRALAVWLPVQLVPKEALLLTVLRRWTAVSCVACCKGGAASWLVCDVCVEHFHPWCVKLTGNVANKLQTLIAAAGWVCPGCRSELVLLRSNKSTILAMVAAVKDELQQLRTEFEAYRVAHPDPATSPVSPTSPSSFSQQPLHSQPQPLRIHLYQLNRY